ncbi:MAG: carbohydrate ABC transporter permease [Oscillospiraceae bacterium]|nr:carbohydrate ABC transporter permease [Oscillospiraceae bacterium]
MTAPAVTRRMKRGSIGRSRSDVIFDAILFVFLTLVFLIVAYPLYFVIISSFSDPVVVARGGVTFLPVGFTLDGYKAVFKEKAVLRGYANSLMYTAVGVCINLFLTIPTGYAVSRKDFFARKPIMMFYIITMFVGGGMMPTYVVVRNLGMVNTMWALLLPGSITVYNMVVCRTFFSTNIPDELLDAAKLDGCGNTRFFISIVLPLSAAITAIMVLYYGVGHWNSYQSALIYLNDRNKWPLQMELRNILLLNSIQMTNPVMTPEQLKEKERLEAIAEMMKYSLIIVSSVPMMILYPFIQKYFVKGVMIGSVKG